MSRIFLASYLVFWLICGASFAYEDDFYVIDDIQIHSSGDSPSDAKIKAFDSSRRRGLEELFTKMGLDPLVLEEFSNDDLEETIKSEQIKSEVIAGNNYSALFKITYDQNYIDSLLKQKKLENSQLEENYLVLPVTQIDDNYLVWERANVWRNSISSAIDQRLSESKDYKLLVVGEDVENKSVISANTVLKQDFKRFEPTLLKYNATGIYLISFFEDTQNQKIIVNVNLIKRLNKKNIKLSFINTSSVDKTDLMDKVADKTINYLLSVNGKKLTNQDSKVKEIIIRTGSYNGWLKVKQRIQDSGFVSDFTIKTISKEYALVSINYGGQDLDLINSFRDIGLGLEQVGENIFQIE